MLRLRHILLATVLVALLTACGGSGSSGPIALPSRTATSRPTIERPTPTRTLPTAQPTTQPTNQPTTQPTQAPTTQPTQAPTTQPTTQPTQPTQAPTTRLTTRPTTGQESSAPATETPSASASSEPSTAAEDDSGSDDISPWWWVALAVVVLGGALTTFVLVRRSRRRRAWEAGLTNAEQEVGWFARDLVPQLRGAGSFEGVAGGWAVAAPRVSALDDELTRLVAGAPADDQRVRATAVQDAVRSARDRIAALVAAGGSETWALDLDAAQAPLLDVLVPPGSAGEQGAGPRPAQ